MKSNITLSRRFAVDGGDYTLSAGTKNGAPLVVLGILSVPFQELANVTIEYPMKSLTGANKFVLDASDEVIRRGIDKYKAEIEGVAMRVNAALMQDYCAPLPYKRRG